MKRLFCFAMTVVLLVCLAVPAAAATKDEVELLYTYINKISAGLTIDETLGIATCTGKVDAKSIVPVKVTVRLQRYQDGSWMNVATWSATGTAGVTCKNNYAVYSGYTYRVYVAGFVYDSEGVLQEAASATKTVNYS